MSALDTLRFAARAAENANREARIVREWEQSQLAIGIEANPAYAIADRCIMCGDQVDMTTAPLLARVSVFEPTRPLCSQVCDARYQAFERSPTLVASL